MTMPMMRASVAIALTGAAAGGASGGTCVSMPKPIGMTVPPTMGVTVRRSQESRQTRRNWNSKETTSRAAPPSIKAVTHTAMKAPDVPISKM